MDEAFVVAFQDEIEKIAVAGKSLGRLLSKKGLRGLLGGRVKRRQAVEKLLKTRREKGPRAAREELAYMRGHAEGKPRTINEIVWAPLVRSIRGSSRKHEQVSREAAREKRLKRKEWWG